MIDMQLMKYALSLRNTTRSGKIVSSDSKTIEEELGNGEKSSYHHQPGIGTAATHLEPDQRCFPSGWG